MSSYAVQVKTLLASALSTPATGGVYTLDDTGRLGITRTSLPAAFSSGIIKPCVLVKERVAHATRDIHDMNGPNQSGKVILEVWFYQDTGYTTIESMRLTTFRTLHGIQLVGAHQMFWIGDVRDERDTSIDANVERSDFEIYFVRHG